MIILTASLRGCSHLNKRYMEYTKETLDNGLRAIYVPMQGTKTVTVLVLVGVGSRYETKEINGISHFLEHMAFKGTEKRPDKMAIARDLDAVGADFNAFTTQEYTGYYVKADMKHFELATDVVADIFLNSTLPDEEIERERGVILGEIDMYEDNPRRQAWYTFNELMLGDQPSGWRTIGPKDVINSLKRDDFITYRNEHYCGPNIAVVVAGNIEVDNARNLVEEYFGAAPSGKKSEYKPAEWDQTSPRIRVGTQKFDQAHLFLGTWAVDYNDDRWYAQQLLRTILGSGMSSRLFEKVREELGLGYYVGASDELYDDYGFFVTYAGVDAKRVDEAVQAITEELVKIRDTEVTQEELTKAFQYLRGGMLISHESSDAVADWFAEQEILGRAFLTPDEFFSKLEEVTPADVKNVAQEIFTDDRLNLAIVGPVKDEESIKKHLTLS